MIEGPVLKALLWAWTNANGRMPDKNTMTPDEITQYWEDYCDVLTEAISDMTGKKPDDYLASARPVGSPPVSKP